MAASQEQTFFPITVFHIWPFPLITYWPADLSDGSHKSSSSLSGGAPLPDHVQPHEQADGPQQPPLPLHPGRQRHHGEVRRRGQAAASVGKAHLPPEDQHPWVQSAASAPSFNTCRAAGPTCSKLGAAWGHTQWLSQNETVIPILLKAPPG